MSKLITLSQAEDLANAVIGKVSAKNYLESANLPSYTIKKQAEAETGYAHTYQLFEVLGEGASATETAVGAKINIPKDMVVSAAELKTVTTADEPYEGAEVGDKYIDLTIANSSGTHVYIPVNDLVDVYTEGNGAIDITNNAISLVVDSSNARGLSVGANGLALALATPDTYSAGTKTADGTAGAMSSADKYKLDNADFTAYTEGNGIDITSHEVSVVIDSTNANGLSVSANGIAMAEATTSASGAMSATDKAKLDAADVDAYTAGNGIDVTSHVVSGVVDSSNANGLSVGANGFALATATTSANGAMSSTDKAKLDAADVDAYTAGNGIDITSHAVSAVVDTTNANGLSVGASGLALAAATTSAAGAMSAADKTKLDDFTVATTSEVETAIAGLDSL